MAGSRSPDSDPMAGEAHPESSLQYLCPSVFICGSFLHGYGGALIPNRMRQSGNVRWAWR
jgi:hypothetical protein